MLNDKRSRSQSITYKVLYAIILAAALIGSVFSFDLYLNEYNSELAVFEKCATLYAYNILSAIVILFCIIVLLIPKIFSCAKNELDNKGMKSIFANSFCGIFCLAYPVVMIYEKINNFGSIDNISILTALLSFLSALYFFFQMIGTSNNRNLLSFLGMCFAVFCILIIFTVHYNSSDILITSPVRVGSLLSYIAIMLFILSEVRFYIGNTSHAMHFSMGAVAMYFGISSTLPKLYLSFTGENGFDFSSKTILLSIELLCGIYASLRLSEFLSVKKFCGSKAIDEEKEEMYELITEIGVVSLDNQENTDENKADQLDNNEYYSEDSYLVVSDNELPDDVGFSGGEEGKFVVEDYESIESDADDDFEGDEISPFEGDSIENSIEEAMEETAEDLAELIDYEQIKNSTGDMSVNDITPEDKGEQSCDEKDCSKENIGDPDEEEDDEDIDRLIDELVHKHTVEEQQKNTENKSKKFKIRFVKKM